MCGEIGIFVWNSLWHGALSIGSAVDPAKVKGIGLITVSAQQQASEALDAVSAMKLSLVSVP